MKAGQWIIVSGIVIVVMIFGISAYYLGLNEGGPAIDALVSDAESLDDELNNLSDEALTGLEDLKDQVKFVEYSLSSVDAENQTIVITVRFRTLRNPLSAPIFVGRIGSDPTDVVQAEFVTAENSYSLGYYSAQLTIPINEWSRIYYGSVPEYDADFSPVILSILPENEINGVVITEGAGS